MSEEYSELELRDTANDITMTLLDCLDKVGDTVVTKEMQIEFKNGPTKKIIQRLKYMMEKHEKEKAKKEKSAEGRKEEVKADEG